MSANAAQLQVDRAKIIRGHLLQTPDDPPNFVRIFISSTFHDFRHERNHLLNNTFPEIEEWCRTRGLEFQVVDLRWGIREGSETAHMGVETCIAEVRNCKKLSIGPNFVAFLGDRYGKRPLPAYVPFSEFHILLKLCKDDDEKKLLNTWYQLDENAIPPVYILRTPGSVIEHYNDHDLPSEKALARAKWVATETTLLERIRQMITEAIQTKEPIEETATHKYLTSVTEQEIWEGIIRAKNPDKHALCFIRQFQNLATSEATAKYVDIDADGVRCNESRLLLENLKNFLVPLKLDTNNIFHYSLEFDPTNGINTGKNPKHMNYLQSLGNKFRDNIKTMIVDASKNANRVSLQDVLFREIIAHANFCRNNIEMFCGHEQLVENVLKRFVVEDGALRPPPSAHFLPSVPKLPLVQMAADPDEDPSKKVSPPSQTHSAFEPIIIHGISGCGKTATMAKLIELASQKLSSNYNIVYRFLGTTPASSTIDKTLQSISCQIAELYQMSPPEKDDYNYIRHFFKDLIPRVGAQKAALSLLIVLDSVDQLSPAFGAFTMNWLPRTLPPNVNIVISFNTRLQSMLDVLKSRLQPESLFELSVLSNKDGLLVLRRLLDQRQRTLQPHQWAKVETIFEKTQNPLLVELTLGAVRRWHSYTPDADMKLGASIIEAINCLFDRLEKEHGQVLVKHALSYLVLAKNGLTEREVEEILSLDDEVLFDVYQFWKPPSESSVGMPPLIWTRLRQDLDDYLVKRHSDDATVISFYQRQFQEVVLARYLSQPEGRQAMHRILAEFYLGVWANKPKPLSLTVAKQIVNLNAQRMCRVQPLRFGDRAGSRFNLRKLNELPTHLYEGKLLDVLISQVYTNYDWLSTKLEACGMSAVIADFDLYLQHENDFALSTIRQTLRLASSTLEHANCEDNLARELLGRLSLMRSSYPLVEQLLANAQLFLRRKTGGLDLEPLNQCFPSANGCLIRTMTNHTAGITALCFQADNSNTLATASKDNTIQIWNLQSDILLHIIELTEEPTFITMPETSGILVAVLLSGACAFYDAATGYHLKQLSEFYAADVVSDVQDGGTVRAVSAAPITPLTPPRPLASRFASSQPNLFAYAFKNRLIIVDLAKEECRKHCCFKEHIQYMSSGASHLVVGTQPTFLAIFHVGTDGKIEHSIRDFTSVADSVVDCTIIDDVNDNIELLVLARKASKVMLIYSSPVLDNEIIFDLLTPILDPQPVAICVLRSQYYAAACRFEIAVGLIMRETSPPDSKGAGKIVSAKIRAIVPCSFGVIGVQLFVPDAESAELPIMIVSCADEAVRMYRYCEEVAFITLPAIWGNPTSLVADMRCQYLASASTTMPYVKLWDLTKAFAIAKKGHSSDTPIHVQSFQVKPAYWLDIQKRDATAGGEKRKLTGVKEEARFLVCSLDFSGQLAIADGSGVVQRFNLPPESPMKNGKSHDELHVDDEVVENTLNLLLILGKTKLATAWTNGEVKIFDFSTEEPTAQLVETLVVSVPNSKFSGLIAWSYYAQTGQIAVLTKTGKLGLIDSKPGVKMQIRFLATNSVFDADATLEVCLSDRYVVVLSEDAIDCMTLKGRLYHRFQESNSKLISLKDERLAFVNSAFVLNVVNLQTKEVVSRVETLKLAITCVTLSDNGRLLFMGSERKFVHIYNAENGQRIRSSYFYGNVAAVQSEQNFLLVANKVGHVSFLRFNDDFEREANALLSAPKAKGPIIDEKLSGKQSRRGRTMCSTACAIL